MKLIRDYIGSFFYMIGFRIMSDEQRYDIIEKTAFDYYSAKSLYDDSSTQKELQ